MGWAEFTEAVKGSEEFDAEFAATNPKWYYVAAVTALKVINRISFTLIVFKVIDFMEALGLDIPFV